MITVTNACRVGRKVENISCILMQSVVLMGTTRYFMPVSSTSCIIHYCNIFLVIPVKTELVGYSIFHWKPSDHTLEQPEQHVLLNASHAVVVG